MRFPILVAILALGSLTPHSFAFEGPLEWLAAHQEMDGHWDSKKYGAAKQTDTATTSLALLALLGAGHSEKVGEFKDNVKRAVAWLKGIQDANGKIFWKLDETGMPDEAYATALATAALSEATAIANVAETRAAAQKAVDYCVEVYPLSKGEILDGKQKYVVNKNVDTPIMGWNVMALKCAKVAGLKVPYGAFDAIIAYFDSVEHEVKDEPVGAIGTSEFWFRPDERSNGEHPIYRLSAIGCLSRQFMGWRKEELEASVTNFIKLSGPPAAFKVDDEVDLYYWYVSTMGAFQQGGDTFRAWNKPMLEALKNNRMKDGDDAHSWNPSGFAGKRWGRVGQTALACLCSEIYYIYMVPNSILKP